MPAAPATFRRRFLRAWLGKRSVWVPVAAGAVLLGLGAAAQALLGVTPGLLYAVGAALPLVGAASAAAWFALGRGKIAASVGEGLLDEADGGQRELLKQLGRRLVGHGDAEGARLADALRKLRRRLDEGVAGRGFEVDAQLAGTAERLMDASVNALARSLSIHQAKEKLHTQEVKDELDATRASLVDEVNEGVHALGLMLDKLQTTQLRKPLPGELPAVREELDAGLAVAQRVEARMAELDASLGGPTVTPER